MVVKRIYAVFADSSSAHDYLVPVVCFDDGQLAWEHASFLRKKFNCEVDVVELRCVFGDDE